MKKNKKILFILLPVVLASIVMGFVFVRAIYFVPVEDLTVPSSITSPIKTVQKYSTSQGLINKIPVSINTVQAYPDSYPRQLKIPSIKVDAKIQYIGVSRSGKMATPSNFTDVGWYQNGVVPGDKGSAIIDGHVDNGLAFPAVFADLGNVIVGDDIYLDTIGGSTLHFKVTKMQNYPFDAATAEIFNQNDGNYLKLITCTGNWSILKRTHDQRLVVTAELIK